MTKFPLEVQEPLLILTRRDPICTLVSLAVLLQRVVRRKYTHIAFVDSLLSPAVTDLTPHYENIVALDIASEVEGHVDNIIRRHAISLHTLNKELIEELRSKITFREAKLLLDIASSMYEIVHGLKLLDKVEHVNMLSLPPLPGVTYLPVSISIALSVLPYIPNISGSVTRAREVFSKIGISENKRFTELEIQEVEKLVKTLATHYLENKYHTLMLDILLRKSYTVNGVLVQDVYIMLEAMYALDEYVCSPITLLSKKRLFSSDNFRKIVMKYLDEIGKCLRQLEETSTVQVRSLTFAVRLMSIAKYDRKLHGKNVKAMVRLGDDVMCYVYFEDSVEVQEKYTSKTVLHLPDGITVTCIKL